MTVLAYDAINTLEFNIPAGAQMVLYYTDGLYKWSAEQIAARPQAKKAGITVFGDPHVEIADCETGDLTPQGAADYAHARHALGFVPCIYCSRLTQPSVAVLVRDIPCDWFIADWTGADHLLPGTVGTQWGSFPQFDKSTFIDAWPRGVPDPPAGGDVPVATDVVDTWVLPGSNGATYCDLHADGGLFTYGGLDPNQLTYVAISNLPENRYNFGPAITPGVFAYPALFAKGEPDIFPQRYFVKMHVYSYAGVDYERGPVGPTGSPGPGGLAGPPGPPGAGLSADQINALHAAGQALGTV